MLIKFLKNYLFIFSLFATIAFTSNSALACDLECCQDKRDKCEEAANSSKEFCNEACGRLIGTIPPFGDMTSCRGTCNNSCGKKHKEATDNCKSSFDDCRENSADQG